MGFNFFFFLFVEKLAKFQNLKNYYFNFFSFCIIIFSFIYFSNTFQNEGLAVLLVEILVFTYSFTFLFLLFSLLTSTFSFKSLVLLFF
ncbi:hypothetical protein C1645_609380 [Glomus cerebriforme]|uniref:Uncharacterized protein n=1 Tax=Glomus cerebriforme TaxID=658196 RepID=A0A397T665_9GLOM|nr:hypothetical protein C1645_609380 [Glomus cerebriforme]